MTLEQLRSRMAELRNERAAGRKKLERTFLKLAATPAGQEADALRARIEALRDELDRIREREIETFTRELDARQFVTQLNAAIPILLVPLRVQCRFRGTNLLVRVYPDDISVQAHEALLTTSERAAGNLFWSAPEVSDDPNVPTRKAIWRGIVSRFELRRAAWIIRTTNPENPPNGDVADHPLRVPAAWTLPERLVFRCYGQSDHQLGPEILGQLIPDGLELGFDPTRENGFKRAGGDLQLPPEIRWQADFDEAIKVGMGVSIPLDRIGNPSRIERLVVLGVRILSDEKQSASLLEQLIEDHRYTDGFSIVPQGTPTNVTDDSDMPPPASPDAMLEWLSGRGAFTRRENKTLYEDESDGLRLAHALGVSAEVMRFVENADREDACEAIAMKRALWAGTLGYYAQQMLAPLLEDRVAPIDPATPERMILAARFFFTHFVFGRGPLPAFRVGVQPYGILPVSGDMLRGGNQPLTAWGDQFLDPFIRLLHDKMLTLSRTWLGLVTSLPRAGAGANANARLLDVLATQASSVEWHGERLIGREYLREYTSFKGKVMALDAFAQMLLQRFVEFQGDFPNLVNQRPRSFDLTLFGGFWQDIVGQLEDQLKLDRGLAAKLTGDVIDNLPFSEVRGIDPAYPNYIQWILNNRFEDVRRGLSRAKPDGTSEPVTALLFMALRHSYLYEHAFAAMRLFRRFRLNTDTGKPYLWSDFAEKELYNVRFAFETTYWDYVTMPNDAGWALGGPQPKRGSVLQLIQTLDDVRATVPDWKTHFGDMEEVLRALKRFADPGFPTARLERLFAEHMDLASYRLDAWITGFVYQRLLAYRVWEQSSRADRRNPFQVEGVEGTPLRYDLNHRPLTPYAPGIYLGAYGWVEGIERGPAGAVVQDLPDELKPRNNNPVTRDGDNYGLIHAPSLNQAVTAAILRSASVTQPDTDAYNIDLSSTRTRDALWIIEGVRSGQSPAALLGYRFERALREADPKLQKWLPDLRATFPMPRQPDTDPGAKEAIPAREVVNGLLVIQARKDKTLPTKLAFAGPDSAVMLKIADHLQDMFDACGDLMLSESVHQAAQGNYDRAGGVVTAAGEFTHVPSDFEVVNTPRSGTAICHRVMLALEADAANPGAAQTPRARLEPALNQWLGTLIGSLGDFSCQVTYLFPTDGDDANASFTVKLDELGIEPIDLLFIADERVQSDLNGRLDIAARPKFEAAHAGVAVKEIHIDTKSMHAQVALLDKLRDLLTAARPGTLRDFVPPSILHGADQDAMDGIDTDELLFRILGVKQAEPDAHNDSSLWAEFEATMKKFDGLDALGATALKDLLLEASYFGLLEAVPQLPADVESLLKALQEQAKRVKTVMTTRFESALAKWTPPLPPVKDVLQLCRDVTGILLGAAFPLMPRVTPPPDLPPLPAAEVVDDWLFRVSAARESAARLQHARVVAEELSDGLATLQVFQWPSKQTNWIALEIPGGATLAGDLVSIVVQPVGSFDPAKPTGALVVDEWLELIPNDEEITGISFHYDAPNAEPPQSLLLAVSQRLENNNLRWTWDEIVGCVDQALLLAKMRAVGTDELRHTRLDAVLPATLAAETTVPATISMSWFGNVAKEIATEMDTLLRKT
jgi:hypothetical protein